MTVAVLINVGASLKARYEAALPGAEVIVVSRGAGSSSYDEKSGLAAQYPRLQAFLAASAPSWQPGDPVVLVAFSAGGWAVRAWLRDGASRELASAVVILDGLHAGFDSAGGCNKETIDGVLQYAWMCNQAPSSHLLVVTHTQIVPPGYASTTQCAALMPAGPGVKVLGYPGSDADAHNQQQREVGPAVLAEIVAPWLQRSPGKAAAIAAMIVGVAVAIVMVFG